MEQPATVPNESSACTGMATTVSGDTVRPPSAEQTELNGYSFTNGPRTMLPLESSSLNVSERQTVRKRRRCHSSSSDVPDGCKTTDSDADTHMEIHSDGENSNGVSPRTASSRQSRRPRRRRRFSLTNNDDQSQQQSGVTEPTITAVSEVGRVCSTPTIGPQLDSCVQPRLPQYLLPFNQRDLELVGALVIINRALRKISTFLLVRRNVYVLNSPWSLNNWFMKSLLTYFNPE